MQIESCYEAPATPPHPSASFPPSRFSSLLPSLLLLDRGHQPLSIITQFLITDRSPLALTLISGSYKASGRLVTQ